MCVCFLFTKLYIQLLDTWLCYVCLANKLLCVISMCLFLCLGFPESVIGRQMKYSARAVKRIAKSRTYSNNTMLCRPCETVTVLPVSLCCARKLSLPTDYPGISPTVSPLSFRGRKFRNLPMVDRNVSNSKLSSEHCLSEATTIFHSGCFLSKIIKTMPKL